MSLGTFWHLSEREWVRSVVVGEKDPSGPADSWCFIGAGAGDSRCKLLQAQIFSFQESWPPLGSSQETVGGWTWADEGVPSIHPGPPYRNRSLGTPSSSQFLMLLAEHPRGTQMGTKGVPTDWPSLPPCPIYQCLSPGAILRSSSPLLLHLLCQ